MIATAANLKQWAHEMDYQWERSLPITVEDKDENEQKKFVSDECFFRAVGFDALDSMDENAFEHCTLVHNLNQDVAVHLHGRYDVIVDAGTMEHVFNTAKVLENCWRMLKVGGRMIHYTPTNGCVEHGFYMFSPTLLHDYYTANKWNIISQFLIEHRAGWRGESWRVYEYTPEGIEALPIGALNGVWMTFVIAEKQQDSSFNATVNQGYYARVWRHSESQESRVNKVLKSPLVRAVIRTAPAGWVRAAERGFGKRMTFKLRLVGVL